MTTGAGEPVGRRIEAIYRRSAPRLRATLIRLLGSFDLAEEALSDAFLQAAADWPVKGVPKNPDSWLVSAGRFRTIDRLRRRALLDKHEDDLAYLARIDTSEEEPEMIDDDVLRLVFTCCHPSLPLEARIAMALRELCGLSTEEIARAFLMRPSTVAQRIVRAKAKIREERIPYAVPERDELPGRLETVLHVLYLVFNEGHARAAGGAALCEEAIRLARLLENMLPDIEIEGLLALMLLQHARRFARTDAQGRLVLLADQDRRLWSGTEISEGLDIVDRLIANGEIGAYGLQAAIAACHARAPSVEATDWPRIVWFYDLLMTAAPSPVVALNRAVAVAEVSGPRAGLALVESLRRDEAIERYHLTHSVSADFHRRLGEVEAATESYRRALALANEPHERWFLEKRLAAISSAPGHA